MPNTVPAADTIWELDRWLDDTLWPAIEALAAALRAQPQWDRDGFRRVVVFSYSGWAHYTGQEADLEASLPDRSAGSVVVVLTRNLPPPAGRTYYAAVPMAEALLTSNEERDWLAGNLLARAIDAVPPA